jgi:precorrin-2/cobalt-factor-2 C20-methyltransferase
VIHGVFYGIGVGPGDPELITVKGAKALARCRHVFVPKSRAEKASIALEIARGYLGADSEIHELFFPMTRDRDELSKRWDEAAECIAAVIGRGEDACFLTLGDPLLYSTYIYLLRALRRQLPEVRVITIPGVTAFSAAAALTEFPVGEGNESVCIIPTADNIDAVREAIERNSTVILMKVGKRLSEALDLLEQSGIEDQCVFVSRAGMEGERIELNPRKLREEAREPDYLSILLIHTGKVGDRTTAGPIE